jgi:hypothetical protein
MHDIGSDSRAGTQGYGKPMAMMAVAAPTSVAERAPRLDQRDMQVISALFPSPDTAYGPRELMWRQFQRTMARLGFSVRPGRGGAGFRFSPTAAAAFVLDALRGKAFKQDRPHPQDVFSPNRTRKIGRKLSPAYGWSADTFK